MDGGNKIALHTSQTPPTLPDPKIWDVVARERHSFE